MACALLLGVAVGYAEPTTATPLYVAEFEAMLDSGFGGLPPTLLQVRYVFKDQPPFLVVPHEAYYEFQSITVTVNGVKSSATPLEIGAQDDLPASGGISRDAYFVVGTVSGTYESNFELLSAGLEFVKFGSPPKALSDLSLPMSVAALSGFTVESERDHRIAFLSFENLATGGVWANSAALSHFTIDRVAEPGAMMLLGLGIAGLGLARRRSLRDGEIVLMHRREPNMSRKGWIVACLAALGSGLWGTTPVEAAAAEIEDLTQKLRESPEMSATTSQQRILELERAIERGERASAGLRSQIKSLQSETERLESQKQGLENEKRALEKIQVVLTSGLIGALVTALVAILGTFLNFARGRAERDLKRLEVLEKSASLEAKGIHVPSDIRVTYSAEAAGDGRIR